MGVDLGSGKAGIHDTLVVHRRYEKFLNQGTRITKKGFELTIPQTGSSNRRGEIRMGWDITERIEEFFAKEIIIFQRN